MKLALPGGLSRRLSAGLLGAIWTVSVGTAAVRAAAAIKDLVVAYRFGTGDALEAFLLAFMLPVFLTGSFRSAFFSAFVPRFLEAEARGGPEGGRRALRGALAVQLVVLVALAAALALCAKPIVAVIASAFPPAKRELTRHFVVLLAPFVVLDGVAGVFWSTLNARKRFAPAALVSAIPPVVTLVLVVAAGAAWGVRALIAGAIVGAALEAAVSGLVVRRAGLAVLPSFERPGPDEAALLRGFGLLALGGILMSANTVVDQTMASGAGAGSVASLVYGAKIPAALIGLAGIALGTTTLPHYAALVAERRFGEMRVALRSHALRLAAAGAAGALVLAAASRPLIRLLFEHGSFVAADTARVVPIQALYALQIPGFLIGIVAARFLNALGRDRWIVAVSGLNFALNIVGNWILLRWIGLPGIALSTAVVYTVSAALLLVLCRRGVRKA